MKIRKCPNCKGKPEYEFIENPNDPEFGDQLKYILKHKCGCAFFSYDTHQETYEESVKDWNRHVKETREQC